MCDVRTGSYAISCRAGLQTPFRSAFLSQMTTRERGRAARADVVDELRALLRRQPLVPVVVDHHDGRAIAGTEALDLYQRERAARIRFARLDAELRAQLLGDTLGAEQRTRQRAADVQH